MFKTILSASLALLLWRPISAPHGQPDQSTGAELPHARNVVKLGNWDGRGDDYGDIWGYTDPRTGREYALICVRDQGLSVVDVTNPASPREVGFAASFGRRVDSKDVKVYRNYAILINEDAPAQIIDLSQPSRPRTVATIHIGRDSGLFGSSGGAHNAFVEGNYLYTVGNHDEGGLIIYDLSNPRNPVEVGQFHPYYYHDVYVREDIAYLAAIEGDGVDILDVSNKRSPRRLVNFNYPDSGAHNVWTTEDGDYLFVGDETGKSGNWTRIFDIRDLENVRRVANYIVDEDSVVHNFYVKGDYLYVGHYIEGFRVVDVSDPTNPTEIGYYDTYEESPFSFFGSDKFDGVWSVYPFFRSGNIVVSDRESGLYVFRLSSRVQPPDRFCFPQVVAGGGFQSSLTIINTSGAALDGVLRFHRPDGGIWNLPLDGRTTASVNVNLAPRGQVRFTTSSNLASAVEGWAELETPNANRVSGSVRYFLSSQGKLIYSVGAAGGVPTRVAVLPAEKANGVDTALAIVNPADTDILIGAQLLDSQGELETIGLLKLAARSQQTLLLEQAVLPLNVPEFTGTLRLESLLGEEFRIVGLSLQAQLASSIPVVHSRR